MCKKSPVAAGANAAAFVLAFGLAAPAWSQGLTDPGPVAATPAAQAAAAAAEADSAAAPAAPQTAAPSYTPASAEPVSPPAAAVVVDPILDEVRQQLAQPARGNSDRSDRAALVAFYADPGAALLWVKAGGFMPRAQHALAEIRRAEDWGLSAAAFDLPQLSSSERRPSALAAAGIKLSVAALAYAPPRRGRQLDPAQVSRSFDQRPALLDPKDVLAA